jgi:hypothetical protein
VKFEEKRWGYCTDCDTITYEFACCGNLSCNGGGCAKCQDRTELDRRLEAEEHPKLSELPIIEGFVEWLERLERGRVNAPEDL